MLKTLTLALSSLALASSVALAANPEADNIEKKSPVQDVLLVQRDANGNVKGYYKVTKKIAPEDMAAAIEKLQKNGAGKNSGIVKIEAAKVSTTKGSKNPEAEGAVAKQSWYFDCNNGYRCGVNPGVNYFYGYWPLYQSYDFNNYWSPSYYRWSYGCGGYTYGIYW